MSLFFNLYIKDTIVIEKEVIQLSLEKLLNF